MITIHHLGVSQSERVLWLCEELGIPYDIKLYSRNADTGLAPPEYKALHPLGTSPIITDGELVLPESGAILEYLIGRYGGGRLWAKPDDPEYAHFLFWWHFGNSSMMPNLFAPMILKFAGLQEDNDLNTTLRSIVNRRYNDFALVEKRLSEAAYFAGDNFTAADIMVFFPISTMLQWIPMDIAGMPHLQKYLKKIADRPAYQSAMKKGATPHSSGQAGAKQLHR